MYGVLYCIILYVYCCYYGCIIITQKRFVDGISPTVCWHMKVRRVRRHQSWPRGIASELASHRNDGKLGYVLPFYCRFLVKYNIIPTIDSPKKKIVHIFFFWLRRKIIYSLYRQRSETPLPSRGLATERLRQPFFVLENFLFFFQIRSNFMIEAVISGHCLFLYDDVYFHFTFRARIIIFGRRLIRKRNFYISRTLSVLRNFRRLQVILFVLRAFFYCFFFLIISEPEK